MGFWISLILWAAVAALLLYGWFHNMGQHRETTKDILVTAGSCIVSLWALRRFLPGPAVSGVVAAAAAAFLLAALVPRTGRLIPRSAAIASAMVIVSLLPTSSTSSRTSPPWRCAPPAPWPSWHSMR